MGGGGSQQINSSDQYYQQLAGESGQLFNQFNQLYLPMLQKLIPELQSTVEGGNSPLMQAAEAPVNAQTGRMMNTIQNNEGGVGNPNALLSDIALNGQQQAGLSGDQMLSQALAALQNLTGMGYEGVRTGTSGLGNAAGGEANLGLQLNQQSNWLPQLLGSAAQAYAASQGVPTGGGGGMFSPGGSSAISSAASQPVPMAPMPSPDYSWMLGGGVSMPSVSPNSNVSAPISSGGSTP